MATQYQIFCRYLNETVNRTLTNQTTSEWISATEFKSLKEYYKANKDTYNKLCNDLTHGVKRKSQFTVEELNIYDSCLKYTTLLDAQSKSRLAVEYAMIRPVDSLTDDDDGSLKKLNSALNQQLNELMVDQNCPNNPKYDMVFMYDGIARTNEQPKTPTNSINPGPIIMNESPVADVNPPDDDKKEIPYLYYDNMKRIKLDPWFLYSTHASLNSAMAKAKELVNILGKDAVKIGKVVPLDQYIEIV